MLTAYLDESGIEEERVVVAGFLGNKEQWNAFGPRWINERGAKKSVHCKELRWQNERTKQLLERLGPVAKECGLTPLHGSVRVSDFIDLVPLGMRPRFKGYLLCLYAVVLHILKSVPVDERVKLVLEQQNEYELSAMRIFALFAEAGNKDALEVSYVAKVSCMLLEPADCLAHCILQMQRDQTSHKSQLCAPILADKNGIGEQLQRNRARALTRDLVKWIRDGRLSE